MKLPYTSTQQVAYLRNVSTKIALCSYIQHVVRTAVFVYLRVCQKGTIFLWCIVFNIREYYPLDITFCWAFCLQKRILRGIILVIHTLLRYVPLTGEKRPDFYVSSLDCSVRNYSTIKTLPR